MWAHERVSPVDSACDRALVRKDARYSALVLGGGTSDERRVVNYTILRGVALGLERPEESLRDKDIRAEQFKAIYIAV